VETIHSTDLATVVPTNVRLPADLQTHGLGRPYTERVALIQQVENVLVVHFYGGGMYRASLKTGELHHGQNGPRKEAPV